MGKARKRVPKPIESPSSKQVILYQARTSNELSRTWDSIEDTLRDSIETRKSIELKIADILKAEGEPGLKDFMAIAHTLKLNGDSLLFFIDQARKYQYWGASQDIEALIEREKPALLAKLDIQIDQAGLIE